MGKSGAFVLAAFATPLAACIDITTSGRSIVDAGARTSGATGTGGTSAATSAATSGSTSGGATSSSGTTGGGSSSGSSSGSGSTTGGCARCNPGFVCQAGECVCPGSEQVCGASCVQVETDNDNCGSCGNICPQPFSRCYSAKCQYCMSAFADGGCVVSLGSDGETLGEGALESIAVDSSHLYWTAIGQPTTQNEGVVMTVSIEGGAAQTLASGLAMPMGLAVDGTNAYWVDSLDGIVRKVPLDGGAPVVLATGQGAAAYIAVDSSSVYWTSVDGGTVMKVSIDGGDAVVLAAGQSQPWYIALDGAGSVYWTNSSSNGAVMKASIDGGAATLLSSSDFPYGIAVSGGFVYWTNPSDATVMRVLLDAGLPTVLATEQEGPAFIAVDSSDVYWSNEVGAAMGMPIAGGTPTALVTIKGAWPIAVDSTSLYLGTYRLIPK